ncbi:MAG: hypothetical protein IJD67_03235 [Clostridia bacterium]|nr:hypothetical protein [Clostridia bacterium]
MTVKDNFPDVCVCCGNPVPEGTMVCPECEKKKLEPWQKPKDEKQMNALSEGLGRMAKVDFKRVFSKQTKNKGEKSDKTGDK